MWYGNLILSLLLVISCGSRHKKETPKKPYADPSKIEELQEKFTLYKNLIKEHQDEYGFISSDCDALLWSSLVSIAGVEVRIEAAKDENGRWYRTPKKDCFSSGRSKSTISRDMLLGIYWHAYYGRKSELSKNLIDYAVENRLQMGEGDQSRIFLTPNMLGLLADINSKLGYNKYFILRGIPKDFYPNLIDFEAHLQVLYILLAGKVTGSISDAAKMRLIEHAARQESNILFQFAVRLYTDGQYEKLIDSLLDDRFFPSDRLPSTNERCDTWLWQRDFGKDWEPCEGNKEHHGGDFIFLSYLILEEFK